MFVCVCHMMLCSMCYIILTRQLSRKAAAAHVPMYLFDEYRRHLPA